MRRRGGGGERKARESIRRRSGPGDRIRLDYAHRSLEIELLADIGKNVSRADAKTLYRVLSDAVTG